MITKYIVTIDEFLLIINNNKLILLKQEKDSSHVQQELFAVLVLLSRLQPNTKKSEIETDDKDLTSIIKSLRSFAKCSIYQVREAAARSLVPMVSNNNINQFCIDLINDYWVLSNQNGLHGSIIQMKYLLKSHLIIGSYQMKKGKVKK